MTHISYFLLPGAVIGNGAEPMLIMEYMDHGSLSDLLKNDTVVIDGEVILPILRDISQGMRFLHSATPQVIHGGMFVEVVSSLTILHALFTVVLL